MKNSFLFATSLIASICAAEYGIEQVITEKILDYAGLNSEVTSVDLAGEQTIAPRVKSFGYENTNMSSNGLIGYELGLNADIGWNYELPLYNQDEFLVFRQRAGIYGGGRQFFTITLYVIKLTVFVDIWLSKVTFDNYLRYNITKYSDPCAAGNWFLDVARVSYRFELDVNECVWGLIGSLTNNTQDCEWGTYYIDKPLFNFQPFLETKTGSVYSTCDGEIPVYA